MGGADDWRCGLHAYLPTLDAEQVSDHGQQSVVFVNANSSSAFETLMACAPLPPRVCYVALAELKLTAGEIPAVKNRLMNERSWQLEATSCSPFWVARAAPVHPSSPVVADFRLLLTQGYSCALLRGALLEGMCKGACTSRLGERCAL